MEITRYRMAGIRYFLALRRHTAYDGKRFVKPIRRQGRNRETISKSEKPPPAKFTHLCGFLNLESSAADLVRLYKVGCLFFKKLYYIRCRGPPPVLDPPEIQNYGGKP